MRGYLGLAVVVVGFVAFWPASVPAAIPVTHTAVAVATTSTAVLAAPAAGASRRLVILQNISDTDIDCNVAGATAVAGEGVRILKSGGNAFFDVAVPSGAIACIHAGAGNKTLNVTAE